MLVGFALTMKDLVVHGQTFDQVRFVWYAEHGQNELLRISHRWMTEEYLLTSSMIGLEKVGESSLTIEPQEDVFDFTLFG